MQETPQARKERISKAKVKAAIFEQEAKAMLYELRRFGAKVSLRLKNHKGVDVRIKARGQLILGELKNWSNHYPKTTNHVIDNYLHKTNWQPENPKVRRFSIERERINFKGKAAQLLADHGIQQITLGELFQLVLSILCNGWYKVKDEAMRGLLHNMAITRCGYGYG
jgi:hypothetical protein